MSGMARSKWIRLKSQKERVHGVCARMLRSRLKGIAHYLPLAAKKSQDNIEYVHQLRIWTRRADAVVDLCRDLLPKSDRRELSNQLDLLRDAAGAARDADVLRDRIAQLKPGLGREHLLKDIERRRREAEEPLVQANEKLRGGQEVLELLKGMTKRFEQQRSKKPFCNRFAKWSREQLKPLIKRFAKRGAADLTQLAKLHKFRIAGKRLRYALELVWGALDKQPRKRAYEQLDRLQTQLGSINDTRNLIAEIEQAAKAVKKRALQTQLRRLLAAEQRHLTTAQEMWTDVWSGKKAKRLERRLRRLV
jgi:CHAD domain-containing protein